MSRRNRILLSVGLAVAGGALEYYLQNRRIQESIQLAMHLATVERLRGISA